jgi:hypothetical protein
MHDQPAHPGSARTTAPAQVLAVGDAARWPEWLEALVAGGNRVEVLPDAERAFVRCVERWIDVVLVDAGTALDATDALERLRRLSPATRILVIGPESALDAVPQEGCAVQAISGETSVRDFLERVRAGVHACRVDRERRERLEQLRGLAHRIRGGEQVPQTLDGWLSAMSPPSQASLSCLDALRKAIGRELDALTASRETADFITRCLPEVVVAVWLAGAGMQFGLAACSGGAGPQADAVVRLMARVERSLLPDRVVAGGILGTEDATTWGSPDDTHELGGRWAMLAPCRSEGRCHAVILILGSREPRPVPAQTALDSVRTLLGAHLARIERVHLRAQPAWPPPAAQEPEDPPSDDLIF